MKPIVRQETVIAKSKIFEVRELDLKFSNGEERVFERLNSRRDAVLIVPMVSDDEVLLIREYAAGVDRYELALPKGIIEVDEPIEQAANRELMEEVGMQAANIRLLKTTTLAPGYMNHITHLMLAQDLSPATAKGDEPEPIEVVPWSMQQLDALFEREDCTEARSIAALLMVKRLLAAKPT